MSNKQIFILIFLFAAFTAQVLYLIRDKSLTTDEASFHPVNGYAFLKTRDFRMSPASPPALREWAALPWLFLNPRLNLDSASWREADSVPFNSDFFFKDNRDRAELLITTARLMTLPLALVMGWFVFAWGRALYGAGGGLVGLALFAFCPTVVGHSALAATDVGGAVFFFLTIYFLYDFYEKRGGKGFPWKASAALGLALASKFTAVLLIPAVLLIAVIKSGPKKGTARFLGMTAAAFLVVWSAYFFEWKPLFENVPRVDEKIELVRKICGGNTALGDSAVRFCQKTPIPFPSWILGFAGIAKSHRESYLHYIHGRWTTEGVWYHYLLSFALKMTLPFLSLLALALPDRLINKNFSGLVYLLPSPLILLAATLGDSTGVGIRYLLPILPFFFVLVGGMWIHARRYKVQACILLALLGHAALSLNQFPNNIAYFNELAGGPANGWRYLRGSDVDWGQELKNLKKYADANGLTHMVTDLFGTRDEAFYGLPSEQVLPEDFESPRRVVYAISANHREHFKWVDQYKPAAYVGNAIFIYDLRENGKKVP